MSIPSLDPSQLAFAESKEQNVRLLAPAGCGKTTSLLYRCLNLASLSRTAKPRFLLVTFTVAAKQELASRLNIDSTFAPTRDLLEITTLNSWGFRRLKSIAFSPRLISSKDEYHFTMRNALQPIWRKHESVRLAIEAKSNTIPRQIMDLIDAFKSIGFDHTKCITLEQFSSRLADLRAQGLSLKIEDILHNLTRIGVLPVSATVAGNEEAASSDRDVYESFYVFWQEAVAHLINSATFTLEDQKYVAYLDEREKLEQGKYLSGAASYDHVLVDEFQDINPLDLALISTITERNKASLTIVGDDDQAIFEWRGATPEYILNPETYIRRGFSTYTLSVNYRSPSNIVELSQNLIRNNKRRINKETKSHKSTTADIEILESDSLNESMDAVYREIELSVNEGHGPSKIAVIGRKRSQIIPYQVFFASKNLSFCAAEDLHVFLSSAFDRLLRLLMIKNRVTAPQMTMQVVDDIMEMAQVIKKFPLSKADADGLRRHLAQAKPSNLIDAVQVLSGYRGSLKGPNNEGLMSNSFARGMRVFFETKTVADSLSQMGETFEGLQYDLGKAEDDIFFTDPPFLYLAEFAERYGSDYPRFVNDLELAKAQLTYLPPFDDESNVDLADLWKRPIHLMTALRAKGKEFDSVILLGVNDGIWPNKNARTPDQREAERRVFYVAFTRARKRLLMLVDRRIGSRGAIVSPFLAELGINTN